MDFGSCHGDDDACALPFVSSLCDSLWKPPLIRVVEPATILLYKIELDQIFKPTISLISNYLLNQEHWKS